MSKTALPSAAQTQELISLLHQPRVKDNPFNFVMAVFPWGKPGTPLENIQGPREWQREELLRIAYHVEQQKERLKIGLDPETYKSAIVSGRGPGKSTLVAWLALWQLSTKFGSTAIITANTDSQLTNKTFGEIGKWHTLAINNYWFERTQKSLTPAQWLKDAMAAPPPKGLNTDSQYYYVKGELWSEDNPDSFVGAHNPLGMMLIFDEASGIPQNIWTVSQGFFTDKCLYRFWFVFSNPRSNTGAFFECFHKNREFWHTRQIDARTIKDLDQREFDEIIKLYGEDSDEARIEVKGEFPKQGDRQFIARSIVEAARSRELDGYDNNAALCMGVDPARYGDDATVIRFRQGRDARSIPPTILKGKDNMEVANECAHLIDIHKPDAVFIDGGAGAGIIDRLKEMGYKVFEVGFGTAANDEHYWDHRTELWAAMRDWLQGAMIDQSDKLRDDLCAPEYEHMGREDKLKLESKEKMKKRGLHSPDNADALAVTFHAKVSRSDNPSSRRNVNRRRAKAKGMDYKVLG